MQQLGPGSFSARRWLGPPPRPPSAPYASSYGQQNPYDNPYNPNPYDPHAHTPSPYDNPNSLYTNPGQVIGHSTPTPDPFINHPSLYDPYGGPAPPGSSLASDRYNSPAPLPGQVRVTSLPLQPQNDYLNPSPLPPVVFMSITIPTQRWS